MDGRSRWRPKPLQVLPPIGLLLFLLSLKIGSVPTGFEDIFRVLGALLTGEDLSEDRIATVLLHIRLPRVLTAALVGAALGTAGASLQGLFRNSLADPGLIGVSSGGAIGAMAAIALQSAGFGMLGTLSAWTLPLGAMAGAVMATFLVYRVARIAGKTHVSTLLLAGIAINALAGSLVGAILYLSDNDALRRFTFWTLGSLHTAGRDSLWVIALFVLIPIALLMRYRRALNAFLLGEAQAYHLGFNTQWTKRMVVALSACMVGVTVAFCGLIAFVGLVIPHLSRLIWGPDFRNLFPASALLGALLLMAADLAARTVNAPSEIPIGVVTSLLGAPFFLYLIHQRKRQLAP
jgi:iron complex transport system permease protein